MKKNKLNTNRIANATKILRSLKEDFPEFKNNDTRLADFLELALMADDYEQLIFWLVQAGDMAVLAQCEIEET